MGPSSICSSVTSNYAFVTHMVYLAMQEDKRGMSLTDTLACNQNAQNELRHSTHDVLTLQIYIFLLPYF